jgi:hypothetical protein
MHIAFVGDFGINHFWNTSTAFTTQPTTGTYPTTTDTFCKWGTDDNYYLLISKLTPTSSGDGFINTSTITEDSEAIGFILADLGLNNSSKLNLDSRFGRELVALDIVCGTQSATQASLVIRVSVSQYIFNAVGTALFSIGNSNTATLGILPVTTSDNGYNVTKTYTIYSNTNIDIAQRCYEITEDPLLTFAVQQGGSLPNGVINTYDNFGRLSFSGIPLTTGNYTSYWMGTNFGGMGGGGMSVSVYPSGGDGDQYTDSNSSEEENEGYDWTGTHPVPTGGGGNGGNDPWDNDGDPQDPNDQSGMEGMPYIPPIVVKIVFSITNDLSKYTYGSVLVGLGKHPERKAKCPDWPSNKWMKIDASGVCWISLDNGSTWRIQQAGDIDEGCIKSSEWIFDSTISGLISGGRPVCGTMITDSTKVTGYITNNNNTPGQPPFYWNIPLIDGVVARKVISVNSEIRDNLKHIYFSDIAVSNAQGVFYIQFWTDTDYGRVADEEESSKFRIFSSISSGAVSEMRNLETLTGLSGGWTESGIYEKVAGDYRYTLVVETPENSFGSTWHCEITFVDSLTIRT